MTANAMHFLRNKLVKSDFFSCSLIDRKENGQFRLASALCFRYAKKPLPIALRAVAVFSTTKWQTQTHFCR